MRVQAGAFLGGDSGILQTKSAYARSADSLVSAAMSPPSPTTVRPTPTTEEALSKGRKQKSNRGLLIEPWVYHEIVRQPVRERVKEVFECAPRLDPKTCEPFGLIKMSKYDEYEIASMFLIWSIACLNILLLALTSLPSGLPYSSGFKAIWS